MLKIVTPPTVEPITTSEAKSYLRVDFSDDDTFIATCIRSAREYYQSLANRSIGVQTLELGLDRFPDIIELPHPPLISVTSVKYKDSAGVETTMVAGTDYLVDVDSEPGRIVRPYLKLWPVFTRWPIYPVRVVYVAGKATIPEQIKTSILYHVALLYRYRDEAPSPEEMAVLHRMYAFQKLRWF